MDAIWSAIQSEYSDLSLPDTIRLLLRLGLAALLGGVIGFERELRGKPAGLRTQVLVAMGTAFFVLVPQMAGMDDAAVSRVLQGAITGIGFLGTGTILKHEREGRIEGLTTAASIWFTAAVGVAVGLGRESTAILGTVMGSVVLWSLPHVRSQRGAS